MRQNPISWKGCVRGAARRGAARVIFTSVTVVILELIHAPKPDIFGRVVFTARRGVSRVTLTWVTVVILELIHAPKSDFLEGLCSRRGAGHPYMVTVVVLELIHLPKPDFLEGLCSWRGAAWHGAGHSYIGNDGSSRAIACSNTRNLWKGCVRGAA